MNSVDSSELDHLPALNVLIIDDNPIVHDTLKAAFENMGIRNIKSAQNAFHGLRLCEEHHFHIVICAFNVKSDKDGFHLLEELKFKGYVNKRTVLIFLSSETSEALVNSIIELQPDDFWVKPLNAKNIEARLEHTLQIKQKLFNIYQAIDAGNYSKVIYYAERHLLNPKLQKYQANLLRMKAEALLDLREFAAAELFYRDLLCSFKYPWTHIGFVKSLLKQDKLDEIETLLGELTSQPETRFATYEMLAEYYIDREEYEQAYDEIKKATALAPRNIERNKKSWDLARLTHDHEGQYIATKNMAQYARNSIHDSPELALNVIRTGIDYANTLTDGTAGKILAETERRLTAIETDYEDAQYFKEQIVISRARLHNAKNEAEKAKRIVENQVSLKSSVSIEDNLDKVKVFHELGMREEAMKLLTAVQRQIAGDSLTSQVVGKYVERETTERDEIHFTPKQLNSMAVEFYKRNRMGPAAKVLEQALQLSPKNYKLAISLLKVLIKIRRQDQHNQDQLDLANSTISRLEMMEIPGSDAQVFGELSRMWKEANGEVVEEKKV
ncbi:response regulator [Corallincola platygyrae]|uniref:Response regulator n=1 Tax=Corallincola platygyrae TaxID=1193278 RepID=A0ABW4XIE5_9GAMM